MSLRELAFKPGTRAAAARSAAVLSERARLTWASGLIIELPQPGPHSPRPSVVEVAANVGGHLVKEAGTEHNGVSLSGRGVARHDADDDA